jgi:spermidine/putrescine transport system substrate-binding protein
MKTLKPVRSRFFLPVFVIFLAACGTGQPPTPTPFPIDTSDGSFPVQIIVHTPANLIDENIVSEFDELADITVIERFYTTDGELITNLNNPLTEIHLVVATNLAASTLLYQGHLAPLNPANIPNLNNIDGRFRNLSYDIGNQYCAPYAYGTIGLGYINGQGITPTSWGDLFLLDSTSPVYGRTTLLNQARETIGAALIYLGYSPNTINATEITQAKQLILQAARGIDNLDSRAYGERLANFEISLAMGFSREFLFNRQVNAEMNFASPQEGSLLQIYSLCIPARTLPHYKRAAEAFINLMLDKEWAANSIFNVELPTTVRVDESQIAQDIRFNPLIYPAPDVLNQAQYLYALGEEEAFYTTAWDEITNTIR